MKIREILETAGKENSAALFASGLRDVDRCIRGIAPGEIMLISGERSAGKTAFCVSCAIGALMKGAKVLYITSDKPVLIAKRFSGMISPGPADNIALYIESMEDAGIEERGDAVPSAMESLFQHIAYEEPEDERKDMDPVEKYGNDAVPWLVIIDGADPVYQYYPETMGQWTLRCELLQRYVSKVKGLAKAHNAAVIVTVRAPWAEHAAELSKEAASCVPLAECACLIARAPDMDNMEAREVFIEKSVRGAAAVATLRLNRKLSRFEDIEKADISGRSV